MLKRILFILGGLFLCFILITLPDSLPLKTKNSILRFASINYLFTNIHFKETIDIIINSESDIVLFLEYVEDLNLEPFGYKKLVSYENKGAHSSALFVKNHLNGSAELFHPPRTGQCTIPYIYSKVTFNSQIISILGVHLPPPVFHCEFQTEEGFANMISFLKKKSMLSEPSIIAGDFNSFSFSDGVSKLQEMNFIDTYSVSNWTYGPTWAPLNFIPSLFRIDYIFSNMNAKIESSYSVTIPGSDHRMVVTDFDMSEIE